MTRAALHLLKGVGYLISTASVVLLAIVSWSSASQSPLLVACLLGGAAASIVGMVSVVMASLPAGTGPRARVDIPA